MPAHRKTLAEHVASGAVDKNPGRFVNDPHKPPVPRASLRTAPTHLDKEQKKVWKEIVKTAPAGVLGTCDAVLVEIAVRLTIDMRAGRLTKTSEMNQLATIMGKLGMTPLDRLRLNATTPSEDPDSPANDELDELD